MSFSPLSLRSDRGVSLSFEEIKLIEGAIHPLPDPTMLRIHMRDETAHLVTCTNEEDVNNTLQALIDHSNAQLSERCWISPHLQRPKNSPLYRGLVRVEFQMPAKMERFVNCSGSFFSSVTWKCENAKNIVAHFTTTSLASKERTQEIMLAAISRLRKRFLQENVEEIREEIINPLKEERKSEEEKLDPTQPLSQV